MVTARARVRGASTLGCLFSVLLFVVALYYGLEVGRVYWKYYSLIDEMKTTARFAQTQTDAQMIHALRSRVDQLGLPDEAKRFTVRRNRDAQMITIRTAYKVEIELPFTRKILDFRPAVEVRQ